MASEIRRRYRANRYEPRADKHEFMDDSSNGLELIVARRFNKIADDQRNVMIELNETLYGLISELRDEIKNSELIQLRYKNLKGKDIKISWSGRYGPKIVLNTSGGINEYDHDGRLYSYGFEDLHPPVITSLPKLGLALRDVFSLAKRLGVSLNG